LWIYPLRVEPKRTLLALGAHLGIDFDGSMLSWRKRRTCTLQPEVGTPARRAHDDPFYRRVLGPESSHPIRSTGPWKSRRSDRPAH
jgi:hypothetical protein